MISINFTSEQLLEFYRGANEEGRRSIKEALGETFSTVLPITDRVQSYDDAVCELGKNHPYVEFAQKIASIYKEEAGEDVVAYLKLRVIVAALNEGWNPNFTEKEIRYYPTFVMNKDINSELPVVKVYVCKPVEESYNARQNNPCLSFKSEHLAIYAAKTFTDIYGTLLCNNDLVYIGQ